MKRFISTPSRKLIHHLTVEIVVFLYLSFSLIVSVSPEINGWVSIWYATDYSIGFSSRLLIGSLLHLFLGTFIPQEAAYAFVIVCFLIIFALLAKIIGYAVQKVSSYEELFAVSILIGMYLASPASPGYLWTVENMGRLETYLFLLSLVIFLISIYCKNDFLVLISSTVIAIICIAIHQVYMFLFFPLLLVIFLHYVFINNFRKSILFTVGFATAILCVVCLFFQFGSHIKYDDPLILTAHLQSKTSLPCADGPIIQEYFWPFSKHFTHNYLPDARERLRYGIITIFLLSPIAISFIYLWYKTILHCTTQLEKIKYILMIATNITFLPAFAILTDWGRWFGAFFTVQFLVFLFLYCKKDVHISYSFSSLGTWICKYPLFFICIILYLSCFEKFEGCNYLNEAQSFYYFTYKIRSLF